MSVISDVIAKVKTKDPAQPEFHQAVEEVLTTLEPTVNKHPEFVKANIYERIVEPDRLIHFRVPWVDDEGNVRVELRRQVQRHPAGAGAKHLAAQPGEVPPVDLQKVRRVLHDQYPYLPLVVHVSAPVCSLTAGRQPRARGERSARTL